MHPAVEQFFDFCASQGIKRICIVTPFELSDTALARFRLDFDIVKIVHTAPGSTVGPGAFSRTTGIPLFFLAGPYLISLAFLFTMALRGRWALYCPVEGRYQRFSIVQILSWRLANKFADWLRQKPSSHFLARTVSNIRRASTLRRLWRSTQARDTHELERSDEDTTMSAFAEVARLATPALVGLGNTVPGRIIHVNAGLAPGGVERQVCLTLAGLKKRGYDDLTFLAEYPNAIPSFQPYRDHIARIGIPVRSIPEISHQTLQSILPAEILSAVSQFPSHLISEILILTATFQREGPEIVHAWQDASCIRAGFAALLAGVPRIVLSARNMEPSNLPTFQPYMRSAYRILIQQKQVTLTVNSTAGAHSYGEWLETDVGQIPVIHNAVDAAVISPGPTEIRHRFGISDASFVVGGIFRFVPQKRPHLWYEIAEIIAKEIPDTHFVIVGDGPLKKTIKNRAAASDFSTRFHFQDSEWDIGALHKSLDLFLLTSAQEGLANVLLEAQTHGVPIVCTDAGGNREAVEDGVTAQIVDPASAESLSSAVRSVLEDDKWRAHAARKGPQLMREKFSLKKLTDETLSIYTKNV